MSNDQQMFKYVTLDEEIGIDTADINTYDAGPGDFMITASKEDAEAFIAWWKDRYDLEVAKVTINFWDGRTLVADYREPEFRTRLTFVFEEV